MSATIVVQRECLEHEGDDDEKGRIRTSSKESGEHRSRGARGDVPRLARIRADRRERTVQTEVLVAGGGPCGLMLANELGRRGIRCLLVDVKPGTAFNPQANATQARTMEHFRGSASRTRFARSGCLPIIRPTSPTGAAPPSGLRRRWRCWIVRSAAPLLEDGAAAAAL